MVNWGYWTFSTALHDAVVVGREGWKIKLALPQCAGVSALLPDFYLMAPDPANRSARQLAPGDGLRVTLHLSYDHTRGYELGASETDARQKELARAVQEAGLQAGRAYYVRVRVFEKMTGSLGVRVLSEPYQGLRGVIHRAHLPGRDPAAQHQFASGTAIGDEFIARVIAVSHDTMAHWQLTLNLRDSRPVEQLPAVSQPASGMAGVGVRRFLPIGREALETTVVERVGKVVRLAFKPRPHTVMVLNLHWHGLAGLSIEERKARFASLAPGDKLLVTPEVYDSPRNGLEVRALEKPARMAALKAEADKPGQHLLVSARITRVYRHKAQVSILSEVGRGLPAYLDLEGEGVPAIGTVLTARLVGVQSTAKGHQSVRLSARIVPAEAGGRGWRLSAA